MILITDSGIAKSIPSYMQFQKNVEMTEPVKKQEELDYKTELSFQDFLCQRAEQHGFSEPKKSGWIKTMSDISKAEETVNFLVSYFRTNIKKTLRVLDVSCGYGSLLIALQQHFDQVYGIEISDERVKWAKKRASGSEVICASATKLLWPDE